MSTMKTDMTVLRIYYENEQVGLQTTTETLTKGSHLTKTAARSSMKRLKEGEYLSGTRLLKLTESGRDAARGPSTVATPAVVEEALTPETKKELETRRLSDVLAGRYMVDADQLYRTIKKNVISVGANESPVTNEEMFMVMSICNTYNLNPFLRHIHAFRHQGKLQVPIGFDGWVHIANNNPRFTGVGYEYPPVEDMVDRGGKRCFPWIKATCNVDGRVPVVVYAFLDEWMVGPNWKAHPNHRLRMKAYAMCIREGLGISMPDEVDADIMKFTQSEAAGAPARVTKDKLDELIDIMNDDIPKPEPVAGSFDDPKPIEREEAE